MAGRDASMLAAASLVIEHTVPNSEGLAFRWWHSKVTRTAKRFKGHIRTDLCAPVKGVQPGQPLKWYSIIVSPPYSSKIPLLIQRKERRIKTTFMEQFTREC